MALKVSVFVSDINNLSDARYCAGMGVEMLGCCTTNTDNNYVAPEKFIEIKNWVAGIKWVGQFNHSALNEITFFLQQYDVDIIQLSSATLIDDILDFGKPIILSIDFKELANMDIPHIFEKKQGQDNKLLIYDEYGKINDLPNELNSLSEKFNIILGSWFDKGNIEEIVQLSRFDAIALKGGNEIKPGFKDFDELADIFDVLEIDDGY